MLIDDLSVLLTIAEVAAAFAGFAAIATIFSSGTRPPGPTQLMRLMTVVSTSILIVIAAFVPLVVFRFGVSELATWRLSSAAFMVSSWVYIAFIVHGMRTLGAEMKSEPFAFRVFVITAEVIFQACMLASASGFFGSLTAAVYLISLVFALVEVGLFFLLLIWGIFVEHSANELDEA